MKKWIGVLDCNNFFVSCERLFRPDLREKPVLVLSSNDGCVVARSQEVKDMAIPMGVPYFQIKDMIKKHAITTFSANLTFYRNISKRVFSVMEEELGLIERYSVDEAFFVLKGDLATSQTVYELKRMVEKKVGVTVSVGLSKTKTQAKYANSLAKKSDGVTIIDEKNWTNLSADIQISKIWGVGGSMEMSLKKHGIFTVQDLLRADPAQINALFGLPGARLKSEVSGQSVLPVKPTQRLVESMTSSRSFQKDIKDKTVIEDAVVHHVTSLATNLRKHNLLTKTLSVHIRPGRNSAYLLKGREGKVDLSSPTNDTLLLIKEAMRMLDDLYEYGVPYRKAGAVCSNLFEAGVEQGDLFGFVQAVDNKKLLAVIDSVNKHSCKQTLMIGTRLRGKEWSAKSSFKSKTYTTLWTDLPIVLALKS